MSTPIRPPLFVDFTPNDMLFILQILRERQRVGEEEADEAGGQVEALRSRLAAAGAELAKEFRFLQESALSLSASHAAAEASAADAAAQRLVDLAAGTEVPTGNGEGSPAASVASHSAARLTAASAAAVARAVGEREARVARQLAERASLTQEAHASWAQTVRLLQRRVREATTDMPEEAGTPAVHHERPMAPSTPGWIKSAKVLASTQLVLGGQRARQVSLLLVEGSVDRLAVGEVPTAGDAPDLTASYPLSLDTLATVCVPPGSPVADSHIVKGAQASPLLELFFEPIDEQVALVDTLADDDVALLRTSVLTGGCAAVAVAAEADKGADAAALTARLRTVVELAVEGGAARLLLPLLWTRRGGEAALDAATALRRVSAVCVALKQALAASLTVSAAVRLDTVVLCAPAGEQQRSLVARAREAF